MRARPPILPPGSKVHPQPLEAPRSVLHRCLRNRAGPMRHFALGEFGLPGAGTLFSAETGPNFDRLQHHE